MGGKSSGGSGDSTVKVRYAKYVEEHHSWILDRYGDEVTTDLILGTPYDDSGEIDIVNDGMLGGKGIQISDYPNIYGLMGLFVTNVDVEDLFDQVLDRTMESPTINNQVSAHADFLSDDINEVALPRFATGMRDMNAVISSTFVIGKSLIETARVKAVSRYDAELRTKLYPIAVQRWQSDMDWRSKIVPVYMEMFKLFMSSTIEQERYNDEVDSKAVLWKYTLLDFYRVAIGTMQGATSQTTDVKGASQTQKALGGALSGGAAGFMLGGPIGGGIGTALGLASSFA